MIYRLHFARDALFRALLVVGLAALLALPAAAVPAQEAGDVSAGEAAAIRGVIESQMAAFEADDASRAFSYASPAIKARFENPAIFMQMVRAGYPAVYRPQAVAFGTIRDVRGQPTQEVFVTGPHGEEVLALYIMERQPDGRWLIDGVVLTERPERIVLVRPAASRTSLPS